MLNNPVIRPNPVLGFVKTVCWIMLFAGLGTEVFFLLIFLDPDTHLRGRDWLFPIAAFVMALISGLALRSCYRREPANFAGFWHLSLADLLASTFFTALLMTAFHGLWQASFARAGVASALILGMGFTLCLLMAARKGCVAMRLKIICALGYYLSTLGFMATGMFVFIILFMGIMEQNLARCWAPIVELFTAADDDYSHDRMIFNVIRIGALCIPIGIVMRRWVDARLKPPITEAK